MMKEYYCQYTEQVRKKRKAWHDGKLKYSTLNNRFTLYSLEDGQKAVSSACVTSSKYVERFLSPSGFNADEHRIFNKFIVIITEMIGGKQEDAFQNEKDTLTEHTSHKALVPIGKNRETKNHFDSGKSLLSLKINKPFKPPTKLLSETQAVNRPSIRGQPKQMKEVEKRGKIRKITHHPIHL